MFPQQFVFYIIVKREEIILKNVSTIGEYNKKRCDECQHKKQLEYQRKSMNNLRSKNNM